MNFKKKLLLLLVLLLFSPINVLAYSDKVIIGGENIGIEVNSDGVLIVGFYEVGSSYIGQKAGFKIGDRITKVNDTYVGSIEEIVTIMDNSNNSVSVEFIRDDKTHTIDFEMVKDSNGVYKTGLYLKDTITGIGTLTYIDPETKIYGALGHEILEKTTTERFDISGGEIFESDIVGIDKSSNGDPGSKEAEFNKDEVYGSVSKNEESGIFGIYTDELPDKKLVGVADSDEIVLGEALIYTVLNDDLVEEFTINILSVDTKDDIKNILFEITDATLLEKTGGVVQGMSGSPILQNNKIIGAVTHVIVNDSDRGYGILITNMLEEGER